MHSKSSEACSRQQVEIIAPELIMEAYAEGYFPMGKHGSETEIEWYGARKRGIMPLDEVHIRRRVLRRIRSKNYHLRINHNFTGVLEGCADRNSTWINTTIHNTFAHLHLQGYAHSVEVWREDKLCGGLYGLAIGTGFFAESVFQNEPECMKIALHFCHQHLLQKQYTLWDVQFFNPFLGQFGCREISEKAYLTMLKSAMDGPHLDFNGLPG